jgi:hypothetical protein
LTEDVRRIQRQAFAGMLWSKQFYYYNVSRWLNGDALPPPPPPGRKQGRNRDWGHLNAHDVISMPDKWEYPWFAAWDLAFHCIPLAVLDPEFAKDQLRLLGQEWYQHPNGQVAAYEWNFGDVNPPVLAGAVWRVYEIDRAQRGEGDRDFLEFMFHKLALNFTWWVNRKDADGRNLFQGGFLGLDNIGVFDRSMPLPPGVRLDQSDGTSWMALFCLDMIRIALELFEDRPAFGEIVEKYLYHFMYIVAAMDHMGGEWLSLWDPDDQFFYDVLHIDGQPARPIKVRSMVGLTPLFAVASIPPTLRVPEVAERLRWFVRHRPRLGEVVRQWAVQGRDGRRLLALCYRDRLEPILRRLLDESEFLSAYGVRALSRHYAEHPYVFRTKQGTTAVCYLPGESDSGMFGGNSNWRGPIWFPVNLLIVYALREYHTFFGDDFTVEFPTGSGRRLTLGQVANELARRLLRIFERDSQGRRPVFGDNATFQTDPHWRDHVPFYEYFHGDDGRGLGASHQTGWTGLIAFVIQGLAAL